MKTELKDNILTIFLEGRIDSNNAPELEQKLLDVLTQNASAAKIQIDVDKLEYISSAGLRVLLKLRKAIKKPLPVINASNELYEIFNVTGFVELLEVHKRMREVSVEGCEVIGEGGYGKVYRLDPETIVKVYKPNFKLEFIEQERNASQKAFIMGVPTAISYDVVKCGDCYGVVYEMINAKTIAQIISKDPSKIPELSAKSARLLKELHKIIPSSDSGLPDYKEIFLNWSYSISKFLTEEEAKKLKNFISAIPDRKTFIHGDYHSKNIMVRNGELQLIDIGAACVGHPIFDIAEIMLVYIIMPASRGGEIPDEYFLSMLGFDFNYTSQVWGTICGTYFGLSSPEEIETLTKKLIPYALLMMSYRATISPLFSPEELQAVVKRTVIERLLPAIDTVEPLDF
ncbi:MAG: anti-sigma factor antagonist [Synergistaceae bacterium]|nr:anti-sigma factor antagonist [Synergistaceae bacterium]